MRDAGPTGLRGVVPGTAQRNAVDKGTTASRVISWRDARRRGLHCYVLPDQPLQVIQREVTGRGITVTPYLF